MLLRHPHVWILTDDMYEHLLYTDAPEAFANGTHTAVFAVPFTAGTVWRLGSISKPITAVSESALL